MKLKSALTALGLIAGSSTVVAGPAALTTPSTPPPAPAPSSGIFSEIGADLSVGYDSHYVFRGVNFGENLVWSDVNVTLPLTQSLELNVGSWYATLADDDYDELDLYAGLSYDLGPVELGVGYTWYYFPRIEDSVDEVGASLGTSVGPLDLSAGYYYDFEVEGHYWEVAAETTFKVTNNIGLVPGVLVGFGEDYYGVSGGNHVAVSLALPIQLTSTATLTPYIAGNLPIDSLDDQGEEDRIYGGVSLTVSF